MRNPSAGACLALGLLALLAAMPAASEPRTLRVRFEPRSEKSPESTAGGRVVARAASAEGAEGAASWSFETTHDPLGIELDTARSWVLALESAELWAPEVKIAPGAVGEVVFPFWPAVSTGGRLRSPGGHAMAGRGLAPFSLSGGGGRQLQTQGQGPGPLPGGERGLELRATGDPPRYRAARRRHGGGLFVGRRP